MTKVTQFGEGEDEFSTPYKASVWGWVLRFLFLIGRILLALIRRQNGEAPDASNTPIYTLMDIIEPEIGLAGVSFA